VPAARPSLYQSVEAAVSPAGSVRCVQYGVQLYERTQLYRYARKHWPDVVGSYRPLQPSCVRTYGPYLRL
jgi:hypothetical protein